MKHNFSLRYGHIILRPLGRKDIEELRVLRNKNKEFFFDSSEITTKQQKEWYEKYLKKENDIMFAVELAEDAGKFIGAIALYDIDIENGTAECGRTLIDKEKAPIKGLGTEATVAVCHIGFSEFKFKKISGLVLKTNARVLKSDARAGFVITGEKDNYFILEMTPQTIILQN